LVDDALPSAQLLQIRLERAGHRVVFTHDGESALATVESAQPDLIILDVTLPGLDGFSVCARLKQDSRT
jgi:two-component system cell cycle response regulator